MYRWFALWRDAGVFETSNHHLVMGDRERVGREASLSAAVLDSQSVKTTGEWRPTRLGRRQEGEGPKASGHGDTDGRGLILEPQPADVQDRDGASIVLRLSPHSFPFIARAFAVMGFAGERPATATSITIEIVQKPAGQVGFAEGGLSSASLPGSAATGSGRTRKQSWHRQGVPLFDHAPDAPISSPHEFGPD
jgi:putative transposase